MTSCRITRKLSLHAALLVRTTRDTSEWSRLTPKQTIVASSYCFPCQLANSRGIITIPRASSCPFVSPNSKFIPRESNWLINRYARHVDDQQLYINDVNLYNKFGQAGGLIKPRNFLSSRTKVLIDIVIDICGGKDIERRPIMIPA